MNQIPTIAVIGRANVGKSTLINSLAGRKIAVVYDFAGVTRDYQEVKIKIAGIDFNLIDTPGFGDPNTPSDYPELFQDMEKQIFKSIKKADFLLFVVDAINGCSPYDFEFAKILYRSKKPVLLVVNKWDANKNFDDTFYKLGFKEILPVSAAHGDGIGELKQIFLDTLKDKQEDKSNDLFDENDINLDQSLEDQNIKKFPLKIAIIGRPNVGKSTLVNSLINEQRLITSELAGATRDSIEIEWIYKNRNMKLIDTAGIRRRAKIQDPLEKIFVSDSMVSLQFCEIAILVIDGSIPIDEQIEKQDLVLASYIAKEGRGLVIAVNKIDQVKDSKKLLDYIRQQLNIHLSQVQNVPCIAISAKDKRNLNQLLDAVLNTEDLWNTRIPTAKLNQWLEEALNKFPPPIVSGRRLKIKYVTQIKSRPPSFTFFGNKGGEFSDSYKRYLVNSIRQKFKLFGVPIRVFIRSRKNPFDPK